MYNWYYIPSAGQDLLLDLYPNARVAYSLRKLRNDYSGNAVTIRRTSDQTDADIGFDGVDFNIADAESFCGASDGYVVRWYDQSGNGDNLTNSTASQQAKIVNAGSVITEGGVATFDSEGITTFNFLSGSIALRTASSSYSMFIVNKFSTVTSTQHLAANYTPSNDFRWACLSTLTVSRVQNYDNAAGNSLPTATIASNTAYVHSFHRTQSTAQVFANGTGGTQLTGLNPPISAPTQTLSYGALGTSFVFQGKNFEFVYYDSDQTANRTGIETNQNDYYGIY